MRSTIATLIVAFVVSIGVSGQRISSESNSAVAQYRIGWQMMNMEAWEDAARAFQNAIEMNPKWADAYYSLGRARMAQRRYVDAITAYSTCRELIVARGGAQFSSQLDANRFRQDRMLEYREEIRAMQQGPQSQTQRGQQTIRKLQDELRFLEDNNLRNTANLTIDSSVPFYVSLALGSAYFRAERFVDAEREYKAAIDDNPNSGEAHQNLAVLYLMTGRPTQAEQSVQSAERAGFRVPSGLKEDIRKSKAATADR
jgi:tetratricopeptide (TPR) repeat protein